MQPAQPLCVGDRVRVLRAFAHLPRGTNGIVQRAFPTVDLYDVLFDERRMIYVVHRSDLALESHERARGAFD